MVYYRRRFRPRRRIVGRRRYGAYRARAVRPYMRRRRTPYSRRPTQHKHGRSNPYRVRVNTVRPTGGISDVARMKFVYAENNYIFPLGTVDTLNSIDISMNDPYDPYLSLGGKSALYFQQMMSLYKYCRVYGAKITLRITDTSSADSQPMFFALVLNSAYNGDAPPGNVDDIMALPKSRCRIMNVYPNRIGSTRFLSLFVHISDIFQITRAQYDNILPSTAFDVTNIGGIVSPTNLGLCTIYFGRVQDTGSEVIQCVGDVRVKYYTKLWVRQSFNQPGDDHVNPEATPEVPLITVSGIDASVPPRERSEPNASEASHPTVWSEDSLDDSSDVSREVGP